MARALTLATSPGSPIVGPNPRVGCVILSGDGRIVGEGFHRGPGTAHAEVAALTDAGGSAVGGTAVVTLEPCDHTGLTGPCSQALIRAGIRRVVFAQADPNPIASGGAATLRTAGIEVEGGLCEVQATAINSRWSVAVGRGRPFVTLKLAASLDGRIAAADGTSRWISGPQSRAQVHDLRSRVDAVVVGTGTVIADDPELTDRRDGAEYQPIRAVLGLREVPSAAKVRGAAAPTVFLRTRDLDDALTDLFAAGVRHVLVEGGATVAAAFLRSSLVDVLVWYVAPVLLGSGRAAIDDLGIDTINEAFRWQVESIDTVGGDVRIELTPLAQNNPRS